jgi:hypothetical protein
VPDTEPTITERLGIRVVPATELPADYHDATVAVHVEDPIVASKDPLPMKR